MNAFFQQSTFENVIQPTARHSGEHIRTTEWEHSSAEGFRHGATRDGRSDRLPEVHLWDGP